MIQGSCLVRPGRRSAMLRTTRPTMMWSTVGIKQCKSEGLFESLGSKCDRQTFMNRLTWPKLIPIGFLRSRSWPLHSHRNWCGVHRNLVYQSVRPVGQVRKPLGRFVALIVCTLNDLIHRNAGIFELIAALMIFVMGITMLKMDRAKAKWRVKLQRAFDGQSGSHIL